MVEDGTLHPLRQVTLHQWRTDYGQAQLRPSGLQKVELLHQVLTLPLDIRPPPIDADHLIRQALEVCLGRFPCQARILELTFQEGNLSSELTDLPANKGQQGGALRLRIQNPFSGLPLS
jgi:hypothetical protein